jgi:CDP-paratose 2-epimerase
MGRVEWMQARLYLRILVVYPSTSQSLAKALYIQGHLAGRSPYREAQSMKYEGATRARVTVNGTGRPKPVVITGGAGFIGTNLADRLLSDGEEVVLFDNLSRSGVERNFEWLERKHRGHVRLETADTRDLGAVRRVLHEAGAVFHFAAQVAVTTSLAEPRFDFEVNAIGTLNILEALRSIHNPPPLIFTSTNKVYGSLSDVTLTERAGHYEPHDEKLRESGISESQRLNFYSPYGCSKGTADQYVLDHARLFGLPAVVLRMSCIYGPHQCGTEDQGWVAHFLLQAMAGHPITLFGDGKQVRDILFVEDLVEALLLARERSHDLTGEAFNLGGGPQNITSLLGLLALITDLESAEPQVERRGWRPGDQRYYVSNFSKFQGATGWAPKVSVGKGVRRLHAWLQSARIAETLATVN